MYTSYARVQESLTVASNRRDWVIAFYTAVRANGIDADMVFPLGKRLNGKICKAILPNGRWLTGRIHVRKGGIDVVKCTGRRSQMQISWDEIDLESIRHGHAGNAHLMQFKVVW